LFGISFSILVGNVNVVLRVYALILNKWRVL